MKKYRILTEILFLLLISLLLLFAGLGELSVMSMAVFLIAMINFAKKRGLEWLGIGRERLWESVKMQMPFMIIGVAGLLIFAYSNSMEINAPSSAFLIYWLVSVPMQEFIFRGYGQGMFRDFLPTIPNVIIVSTAFSLLHVFTIEANFLPILLISTFTAGLAWGLAYEKERNLIGPIVGHLVLGTLIFLMLPASGI
jgi:membrane protease YdiL (CAAX protease family)